MRGFSGGSRRPRYTGPPSPNICPETGEEVSYFTCASRCPKYGVHAEGDSPRCFYEYQELLEDGFYARTQEEWLEHLRHADPKTWQRLVEEEKDRERVRRMIDGDWFDRKGGTEFGEEEPDSEQAEEDKSGDDTEEEEEKHEEDKDDEKDDEFKWEDDDEEDDDGWW